MAGEGAGNQEATQRKLPSILLVAAVAVAAELAKIDPAFTLLLHPSRPHRISRAACISPRQYESFASPLARAAADFKAPNNKVKF